MVAKKQAAPPVEIFVKLGTTKQKISPRHEKYATSYQGLASSFQRRTPGTVPF